MKLKKQDKEIALIKELLVNSNSEESFGDGKYL